MAQHKGEGWDNFVEDLHSQSNLGRRQGSNLPSTDNWVTSRCWATPTEVCGQSDDSRSRDREPFGECAQKDSTLLFQGGNSGVSLEGHQWKKQVDGQAVQLTGVCWTAGSRLVVMVLTYLVAAAVLLAVLAWCIWSLHNVEGFTQGASSQFDWQFVHDVIKFAIVMQDVL